MTTRLGIIAGAGALPLQVAAAHRQVGGTVFIIALAGITGSAGLDKTGHAWCEPGHLQAIMDRLHAESVEQVVMVGAVSRPSLSHSDIDARMAGVLARAGASVAGDDGLLRAIAAEFERDGFQLIGAEAVLGDATAPAGLLAGPQPDPTARFDIRRGAGVLRQLGPADVGQSVAVQQGIVLAVEAIEGTDAMIARAGALRRPGAAPVLVKMTKPGQDRRTDLPTVGPNTVGRLIEAGFRGMAIEAGATLVVDRDDLFRAADAAGLFVVGIDASGEF